MANSNSIIISQSWGGLGDNLQFTTLPELYSQLGCKVFISTKNSVRNQEIYDLVWKLNPFISGTSDLEPNAGECVPYQNKGIDFITAWEINHGLYNGFRKYPVIYYKPKLIPELTNCILYDSTSTSVNPPDALIKPSFEAVFNRYPNTPVKKLQFVNFKNRELPYFNHEKYMIHSIYDLCDAIYSCKALICLLSGASVLATAIKQDNPTPDIYTFHEAKYNTWTCYKFKNNIHLEFLR